MVTHANKSIDPNARPRRSARELLEFMRKSPRAGWMPRDLATRLDYHLDTVKQNLRRLVKTGEVKSQRRGRYFVYAVVGRSVPVPDPGDAQKILGFLRKLSLRNGGRPVIVTHAAIALTIGRSWATVYKYIKVLKQNGSIKVERGFPANTYALVELETADDELAAFSIDDEILTLMRKQGVRTDAGLFECSVTQSEIAEKIGRTKNTVWKHITRLTGRGRIETRPGRPKIYIVPAAAVRVERSQARRGEPPAAAPETRGRPPKGNAKQLVHCIRPTNPG